MGFMFSNAGGQFQVGIHPISLRCDTSGPFHLRSVRLFRKSLGSMVSWSIGGLHTLKRLAWSAERLGESTCLCFSAVQR